MYCQNIQNAFLTTVYIAKNTERVATLLYIVHDISYKDSYITQGDLGLQWTYISYRRGLEKRKTNTFVLFVLW